MADWYGAARSNYFSVKDITAFRAWAKSRSIHVDNQPDAKGMISIDSDESGRNGAWPSEDDDCNSFDLIQELSEHLVDGQVAVLMQAGAEKLCYITGNAVAVHSNGKYCEVSLNDIYAKAAKKFKVPVANITVAEY